MENKTVAVLVLATVAALIVASAATYATMGRQTANTGNPFGSNANGYRMGSSMMGGSTGYVGGMMGGYSGRAGGMMGAWNGTSSMYGRMQQMHDYMQRYWNSTAP